MRQIPILSCTTVLPVSTNILSHLCKGKLQKTAAVLKLHTCLLPHDELHIYWPSNHRHIEWAKARFHLSAHCGTIHFCLLHTSLPVLHKVSIKLTSLRFHCSAKVDEISQWVCRKRVITRVDTSLVGWSENSRTPQTMTEMTHVWGTWPD